MDTLENNSSILSDGPTDGPEVAGLFPLAPITVVVGHYGVGKTNFSLNLAIDAAALGQQVTLIDLDVVNPYFRSSEYASVLKDAGVTLISPVFAGSTLDSPSLSGTIDTVLTDVIDRAPAGACACEAAHSACLIIDAGGDDVGATALGRFAGKITPHPYTMLYVINAYRNLTHEPEEAAALLAEIEIKSHLKATGIVNNSHLQDDTTDAVITDAQPFAQATADLLSLPLVCTTVPNTLVGQKNRVFSYGGVSQKAYPVKVYVRAPWHG
ncbi:MAG: ParA family protein [Raoultibacter sp.]